jgi:hypothetical protein
VTEFESEAALNDYHASKFAGIEVTVDLRYTGAQLAPHGNAASLS